MKKKLTFIIALSLSMIIALTYFYFHTTEKRNNSTYIIGNSYKPPAKPTPIDPLTIDKKKCLTSLPGVEEINRKENLSTEIEANIYREVFLKNCLQKKGYNIKDISDLKRKESELFLKK